MHFCVDAVHLCVNEVHFSINNIVHMGVDKVHLCVAIVYIENCNLRSKKRALLKSVPKVHFIFVRECPSGGGG